MFGWVIIIIMALGSGLLNAISPAYRKLSQRKKPEGLLMQGWSAQILGLSSIWISVFMIYAASHFLGSGGAVHYIFPNWLICTIGFLISLVSFIWGISILRNWGEYDSQVFCWHGIFGKREYSWLKMTSWQQKDNNIIINFGANKFQLNSNWIGYIEFLKWLKNKEINLISLRGDGTLISVCSFEKIQAFVD